MKDLKIFLEKYKKELDLANKSIDTFHEFIRANEKAIMNTPQNRLIVLFIVTYLKEIETSIVCIKKGLLTAVPLLLKKAIEAWRYQLYYSVNEDEAEKYMYNDAEYKKPRGIKLGEAIDKIIKENRIYKFEEQDGKFHQDFIRKYYDYFCEYSHMDISSLKDELIDKENKLNLGINSHYEILLNYFQAILILLAIEIEFINHNFKLNAEKINSKYLEIIEAIKKINNDE